MTTTSPVPAAVGVDGHCGDLLAGWDPAYAGHVLVTMPPTWRASGPATYTFVLAEAVDGPGYERFYRLVPGLGLPRPRLVSSTTLELASLFHPLFFAGIVGDADALPHLAAARAARVLRRPSPSLRIASARYWLQSMLFLAGVTLSAAIVQDRWSRGTLESKLDRLWQAGAVAAANGPAELHALGLRERVLGLAPRLPSAGTPFILELKSAFAEALAAVVPGVAAREETMRAARLAAPYRDRFGFVADLRDLLGRNLRCVLAYGSSVNSASFADYDLILVVERANEALERLAGLRPAHRGKELNMSVFGEAEFATYQLASGDNLTHHAVVLFGEVAVPEKTVDDLLLRNFSFGFVRLRQLLGMAAFAAVQSLETTADDKRSLYGYFEKIPLNVAKGIRGAAREDIAKERVAEWTRDAIGYEVSGAPGAAAIARAAWATEAILTRANADHGVYRSVPQEQGQLWTELEDTTRKETYA